MLNAKASTNLVAKVVSLYAVWIVCCIIYYSPSRMSTINDATDYRESFMKVMVQIQDWSYIVINNDDDQA